MKKLFILIMLFFIFMLTGCNSSSDGSFAYQGMIRWDNRIYIPTGEQVSNIDQELGQIEHYVTDETDSEKNRSSNFYKEGTRIFSIKGVNPKESIAVEEKTGYFIRADFEEKK